MVGFPGLAARPAAHYESGASPESTEVEAGGLGSLEHHLLAFDQAGGDDDPEVVADSQGDGPLLNQAVLP